MREGKTMKIKKQYYISIKRLIGNAFMVIIFTAIMAMMMGVFVSAGTIYTEEYDLSLTDVTISAEGTYRIYQTG